MKFIKCNIPEIILIEPEVFGDKRGFFYEFYHKEKFEKGGICVDFVQDNHSKSSQGTLRGLHYQLHPKAQGKLVRVIEGEIFDIAVDIRKDSPNFGQWLGLTISAKDKRMVYVPTGFAHGFYVLSEFAQVEYKCTELYDPAFERGINWADPDIGIKWPFINNKAPIISPKDKTAPMLKDAEINL